jgi:hypothetical protein
VKRVAPNSPVSFATAFSASSSTSYITAIMSVDLSPAELGFKSMQICSITKPQEYSHHNRTLQP